MQNFYDTYRMLRDAKRAGERAALQDALETADRRADKLREALAAVDSPAPPSKAHKARIARNGKGHVPAPRVLPAMAPDARARLDFHQAMIAQLGGSRTVAPARGCEITPPVRYLGVDELGNFPKS